ncbi:RNase H-like domain found in reverse transcriptase [Popillia japonica]|uniref:RNase H-like domain found in reverse transcriptase n=1 Tax=Popillia japonica TaxID=7064 RepID=A0AAW1JCW1_POPJA
MWTVRLRDRIVLGIINKDLRKRIMATSDLTLERAIDMCRIDEITNRRLLDIKDTDERVCKICKGRNHFAKVCKKKHTKNDYPKKGAVNSKHKSRVKKINQGDDSEDSEVEEEVYKIDKIIDNSKQGGGVLAEIKFWVNKQWKNIKCELDKGATVSNGLNPDYSKVEAIQNFPRPEDKKSLLRYLGMVNYLGRYIKNLSQATNNLRLLTHNETKWNWNQETEKEFNNIKKIISNINTLKYYNVNEPIILECDASGYGLGVAAYQNNGIIGFASRTLTKSEQNFAQIEKELLAIVFGCVRFDQLMVGNQIMVKTDHKPLINIFKKPLLKTPKRLQRMLMLLQRYDLKITYVSGKDNKVADALSRAPLQYTDVEENKEAHIFKIINEVKSTKYLNVTSRRMKEIKEETNKDPDLQTLMKYINTGWPENKNILPFAIKIYNQYKHELSIQDGIIYRGDQVLIPYKLRRTMIDKVHTSHNGINATFNL